MEYKGPELYKAAARKEEWRSVGAADSKLKEFTVGRNTILHLAVNYGEKEVAERILKLDQSLLYKTNDKGDTPLHIAARLGDVEMAELLIKYMEKQDVEHGMKHLTTENKDDGKESKDTVLHVAVRNGHVEIVKLLIGKAPSLASMTNKANESPLFMAVDREYYNIAYEILKLPECSTEGRHMMNALHAAVIRTHKFAFDLAVEGHHFKPEHERETSKCFREFILNLIKRNCSESGQLYHVDVKRTEFVEMLIKKCKPEKPDFSGWIPLHYAAHWGDVELVRLFLKHDKSLAYCMTEKEGMTALHVSAKSGHVSVMKELIKDCPDICELVNKGGRTALHLAVESGKVEPVLFLLRSNEYKNLINEQDHEGNTALHLAATRGYVLTTRCMSHFRKVDRVTMNNENKAPLDILRSITQKSIVLWLLIECRMGPLIRFIWYHIGYLPSLEEAATREGKEAHTIETKEQGYDQGREIKIEDPKDKMGSSRTIMIENDGVNPVPTNQKNTQEAGQKADKHEKLSATFLLIATIISTVTFQAAFQVPGGYNSEGRPNLSGDMSYKTFLLYNSVSFGLSAFLMFFHFIVAFFPQQFSVPYPRLLILLVSEFSLTFMISAFMSALNTQHSVVASVAGYGASCSFLLPFSFIGLLYLYFYLKSVSKYRFPFFPSKYLTPSP